VLVAGELCEQQEASCCMTNAFVSISWCVVSVVCVTKISLFVAVGACRVVSCCERKSLFQTKARLLYKPL